MRDENARPMKPNAPVEWIRNNSGIVAASALYARSKKKKKKFTPSYCRDVTVYFESV
jgi:hypothetical protein